MKRVQNEFLTDGELYDEALTRNTYVQAEKLKTRIEKRIANHGFINIMWIVSYFSKLPEPKNPIYAYNHGWIKDDVVNFTIKQGNDDRFSVYVGTPRLLTPDIILNLKDA